MAIDIKLIKNLGAAISSASGLVKIGDRFYTIADDQLNLFSFTENDSSINALALFPGKLPENSAERKAQKPDLEALLILPGDLLLAVPSGSKPKRCKGALVDLESGSQAIDFSRLYSVLLKKFPELNIEGAVLTSRHLKLFQRGNGRGCENAVISLARDQFLEELKHGQISEKPLTDILKIALGNVNGTSLGFTDAAIFDEKTLAFLAVAEKTESTYLDGEYGGAVFGFLDEQGRIILQEEVLCPEKPEGLWLNPDKSEFFVVTDTDNPQKASALYKGPVPKLPKAEQ